MLERNPFETLDQSGVGDLMRIAVERGRGGQGRPEARASAASTAASPPRSRSATGSGSTTSPARRTACRWRGWPRRRRRSPRGASRSGRRRLSVTGMPGGMAETRSVVLIPSPPSGDRVRAGVRGDTDAPAELSAPALSVDGLEVLGDVPGRAACGRGGRKRPERRHPAPKWRSRTVVSTRAAQTLRPKSS